MSNPANPTDERGQPTWRVALFYPQQGGWTEHDYLSLDGGPLVEYDTGFVEILDMPTKEHQRIAQFLFVLLQQFVVPRGLGEVFMAPLPVRLWPGKYREPDVVFVDKRRDEVDGCPDGADLVIEVISPGAENRRRDKEIKPAEYARARVAEYWIVDPERREVTVHYLVEGSYRVETHGSESSFNSRRLTGLSVQVTDILAAADAPTQ